MRVKLGDKWYSSEDQPIGLQLSELEQKQISEMDRSVAVNGKYACFPDTSNMNREQMIDWMKG